MSDGQSRVVSAVERNGGVSPSWRPIIVSGNSFDADQSDSTPLVADNTFDRWVHVGNPDPVEVLFVHIDETAVLNAGLMIGPLDSLWVPIQSGKTMHAIISGSGTVAIAFQIFRREAPQRGVG